MKNTGKISQIIGAVVDLEFKQDQVPALYNAIVVNRVSSNHKPSTIDNKLILEVQQHLGEGVVRAVAMSPTDGLVRGMEALDTGLPIAVPVGEEVLGRLFNVLGETIDEKGPIKSKKTSP